MCVNILGPLAQHVRIDPDLQADYLEWKGYANGNFVTSVAYNQAREVHEKWGPTDVVWCKGSAQKIQLCLYKLFKRRLFTMVRLGRFGIPTASTYCVLCWQHEETVRHLFFEYEISRRI